MREGLSKRAKEVGRRGKREHEIEGMSESVSIHILTHIFIIYHFLSNSSPFQFLPIRCINLLLACKSDEMRGRAR